MSAQNKILLGLIAVIAFVIGISYNSARISEKIDTEVLLNAQLITPALTTLSSDSTDSTENSVPAPAKGSISPEGSSTVKESLGELTLVNFWASWCSPCREEMPIFETMFRQFNPVGFMVIGIAIDSQDNAQPMLDSMDISYPILYAETTGTDIMDSAGNPQALLPYSLLLDKNGNVLEQVLGQIHEQQIADWVTNYL